MRHPVDDVVDAKLESLVGDIDGHPAGSRPLPVVPDVVVVVGDDHEPLGGVVVLKDAVVNGLEAGKCRVFEVERLDIEEGVEDPEIDVCEKFGGDITWTVPEPYTPPFRLKFDP